MNRMSLVLVESRRPYTVLTNKPVYRDQALADGVDGQKQSFQSDSSEQCWTFRRNKAWSGNFIAVQSQSCLGYGPHITLSASDNDALRTSRLELKLFGQQPRHNAKSCSGVHQKLNFFNPSCRAGQMGFYMEQSHIKYFC